MVLKGHTGSVLCLQYNEQVIVTGSSDSTIRYIYVCVWGGGGHYMHDMVHKYSILMAFTLNVMGHYFHDSMLQTTYNAPVQSL